MASGGKRIGAGRPAKGYSAMCVTLSQKDKETIKRMSEEMAIPQGEVISHLLEFYHETKG